MVTAKRWEVRFHVELRPWYEDLDPGVAARVEGLIDYLKEYGPGAGRPTVGKITSSRHPHMKELITGSIRILFAFDPRGRAILLAGGNKRGEWNRWYEAAIPLADDRYDKHLMDLKEDNTDG